MFIVFYLSEGFAPDGKNVCLIFLDLVLAGFLAFDFGGELIGISTAATENEFGTGILGGIVGPGGHEGHAGSRVLGHAIHRGLLIAHL